MALNKEFDPMSEMPGLKKMAPLLLVVVALFFLWAFSPFTLIGAGERGVVYNKVQGRLRIIPQGFHFVVPYFEQVTKMDVRIRKSDTHATAASKDFTAGLLRLVARCTKHLIIKETSLVPRFLLGIVRYRYDQVWSCSGGSTGELQP